MMRILSLELKNFRQYAGEKHIRFENSNDKNFTIIQGANGTGKTNLLNALTWCLYGEEKHLSKSSSEQQLRPVSDIVLSQCVPGESIETSVSIVMGNETPEYRIKRILYGFKDREGYISYDQKENFSVLWRQGKDWKLVASNPNYFVNLLLPKVIHDFFFFDGEKLDDFFKSESSTRIRDAIVRVAQINLLDNAVDHLDGIEAEIRRQSKGLNPNIERITDKIERFKIQWDSAKGILATQECEEKELRTNIESIGSKLKGHPVDKIQRLQFQRENIESENDELEASLREEKAKGISHLVECAPFVYCRVAILRATDMIKEKYKKGELPPKIREHYLRELLDSGVCICGNDISNESPSRKNIERLMKSVQLSNLDDIITNGKFEIQNAMTNVNQFLFHRNNYGSKIASLEDNMKMNNQRLQDIKQQIDDDSANDIVVLEANREKLRKTLEELIGQMGETKANIKQLEYDYKRSKDEYDYELKKSEKFESLRRQLELCEKSEEVIKNMRNQILEQVKQIIQEKTKEYFMNMIWKKETFVDVIIGDNYNISVIHKGGWDALPVLSAGERQVLALSFMAALREAANVEAPVVIDTPLGRISGEPKENIAEMLPKYLKNCQVILFVTDQEYTFPVRQLLLKYISSEYKLQFDEKLGETTVIPYGV